MNCTGVPGDLQVVALGVGTKFMEQKVVKEDAISKCLRDCHAEVHQLSARH